jgi:hypothetical protein
VTPFGSHSSGFQPRGASADHDHFSGDGRFVKWPERSFLTGGRVLDAGDRLGLKNPFETSLVAGNAVPYIIYPTLPGLLGEIGIAKGSPRHADHIGEAVGQDFFSQYRIVDAADGDYR